MVSANRLLVSCDEGAAICAVTKATASEGGRYKTRVSVQIKDCDGLRGDGDAQLAGGYFRGGIAK
jgi:hypothetical protein